MRKPGDESDKDSKSGILYSTSIHIAKLLSTGLTPPAVAARLRVLPSVINDLLSQNWFQEEIKLWKSDDFEARLLASESLISERLISVVALGSDEDALAAIKIILDELRDIRLPKTETPPEAPTSPENPEVKTPVGTIN